MIVLILATMACVVQNPLRPRQEYDRLSQEQTAEAEEEAGLYLTEQVREADSLRTATAEAAASPRVGTYTLDGGFRMDSQSIKNELVTFGGNDNYRGAVLTLNHNEARLSVERDGTVTGYFSVDVNATITVNPSPQDPNRHTLAGSGTGNVFPDLTGGVVVFDLAQAFEPPSDLFTYPARISSQATFYFVDEHTLAFCMELTRYAEVIRKEACVGGSGPLAILKKTQ
jgi:hypothetical protein